MPHLALGALLVVVCATGFAVAASRVDHRQTVLALARPVTVGQVLTADDLRPVRVSVGAGADAVPAAQSATVEGQPVAYSLPAGALLTRAELGVAAQPPAGQAVVAVAVKPGQFPPELAAGSHVLLVAGPSNSAPASSATGGGSSWSATVTGVQVLDNQQGSIVSLQLPSAQATRVAAVPAGDLDVVLVATGR